MAYLYSLSNVEKLYLRTVLHMYFLLRISFTCLSISVYLLFFVGWKVILHWLHILVLYNEEQKW